MKLFSKILIFFLIFKISLIFGQTNQDIVKENKSWSIVTHNPSMGPFCVWKTYEVKLSGDTTIDLYQYKIVRQSEFGFQPVNWEIVGFLRENSAKKVYYKNNSGEVLLYDFNVSVNDTINITRPYINPNTLQFEGSNNLKMIVSSIDSVNIDAGLKKRIKLKAICDPNETTEWIESIGDIKGIFNSIVPLTCIGDSMVGYWVGAWADELLCCKEQDSLLFMSSVYNTCYYSTVGIKKSQQINNEINIYPNPMVSYIFFLQIKDIDFIGFCLRKVLIIKKNPLCNILL